MSKKPKRTSPGIDMTAMVDVAFLLLTFFILTTTRFREEAKVEVDTPSSVSNLEVPDKQLAIISVGEEGEVFIGYTDIGTRGEVLKRFMSDKMEEGEGIVSDGTSYFSTLQDFGVPVDSVAGWLNGDYGEVADFPHSGIPVFDPDSMNAENPNELVDWIRWSRLADQRMRFAIKGDVDTQYETISDVIASLQYWKVNQFSLITEMEDGGVVEEE